MAVTHLSDLREQFDYAIDDMSVTSDKAKWFRGVREQSSLFQRRLFFRAVSQYNKSGAAASFFDWLLENQDEIISLLVSLIRKFLDMGQTIEMGPASKAAYSVTISEAAAGAPPTIPVAPKPMPSVTKATKTPKETKAEKTK
jgi:hypothetical protein